MHHDPFYPTNTCGTPVLATSKFLQKFQDIIRAIGSVVFKINFAFAHIILSAVDTCFILIFPSAFHLSVCKPSQRPSGFLSANLLCPFVYLLFVVYFLSVRLSFQCHPDMSGCKSSFKALHLFKGTVQRLEPGPFKQKQQGHYHKWSINPFNAADRFLV